mmetsp:Transcript_88300/g.175507  ORF Transcript_88300/g.175507 Transcript_88300/m.175507 type:complete len:118 (-) Transcript_88300:1526-1879(-)
MTSTCSAKQILTCTCLVVATAKVLQKPIKHSGCTHQNSKWPGPDGAKKHILKASPCKIGGTNCARTKGARFISIRLLSLFIGLDAVHICQTLAHLPVPSIPPFRLRRIAQVYTSPRR